MKLHASKLGTRYNSYSYAFHLPLHVESSKLPNKKLKIPELTIKNYSSIHISVLQTSVAYKA
jgi:hypothetical protein